MQQQSSQFYCFCFGTPEAKQAIPAGGKKISGRGLTRGVESKAIGDLSAGSFFLCQSMIHHVMLMCFKPLLIGATLTVYLRLFPVAKLVHILPASHMASQLSMSQVTVTRY